MERNVKIGPRADKKLKNITHGEQKTSKMGPKNCQAISPTLFNSSYPQQRVVNFYIQARQFRIKLTFDSLMCTIKIPEPGIKEHFFLNRLVFSPKLGHLHVIMIPSTPPPRQKSYASVSSYWQRFAFLFYLLTCLDHVE